MSNFNFNQFVENKRQEIKIYLESLSFKCRIKNQNPSLPRRTLDIFN